ncbi:MAG: gluconokinase [Pseudomonadota bacterium]|nr:gluconokinase [Pseudomonadota bacterium]
MNTSPRRMVVMGVSGCGKSDIGQRLATALGMPFVEGDAWHSPDNIAKMAAGIPLTDDNRAVWLATLRDQIANSAGLVLSCSALKRRYRDLLREGDPALFFVELDGSRALIEERMRARRGHFMPTSLLDSQFRDLEPLQADEAGLRVDISGSPAAITDAILVGLNAR